MDTRYERAALARTRRARTLRVRIRLARTVLASLATLALATATHTAGAQKVFACPQPDGPVRYQDRPCTATPPSNPKPAAPERSAREPSSSASSRSVARSPAALRPVDEPRSPSSGSVSAAPETRAEYVARNARRCEAGDRRACVAVTCERSGGLGTKECQAALGYRRGAGWDLRPSSDVFDPARREDEYALRCTQAPRRARVTVGRDGGVARVWAGEAGAVDVPVESIAAFAQRFCTAAPAAGRAAGEPAS